MPNDRQILSTLVKRFQNRESDPFRPLVDDYILKRDASPNRAGPVTLPLVARSRPGGRLSPSTIGGCQRQAAFKFLGTPGRRRIDPDLALIFDDGDWRHHKWEAIALDMEAVLGPEVFKVLGIEFPCIHPKLFIAGHGDLAARMMSERYVVDFKGINDQGFYRVVQNDEPNPAHVKQVVTYARMMGIPRGLIMYENKNTQETQSFIVSANGQVWKDVREWCMGVLRQLQRRELPMMHPDCRAGNFLFEKCPYAHLCYGRKSESKMAKEVFVGFPGVRRAWQASQAA